MDKKKTYPCLWIREARQCPKSNTRQGYICIYADIPCKRMDSLIFWRFLVFPSLEDLSSSIFSFFQFIKVILFSPISFLDYENLIYSIWNKNQASINIHSPKTIKKSLFFGKIRHMDEYFIYLRLWTVIANLYNK